MRKSLLLAAALLPAAVATPLAAQEAPPPTEAVPPAAPSVFDGDWLTVGVGAIYTPSYTGSDDYELSPFPLVQGNLGGIGIAPRPAGVALDFIPDTRGETAFALGPTARVNRNRASRIKDPVVEALGELDTAIEVGAATGVSFPALLNPYDSLSFNLDAVWDIAGAHDGMSLSPSISYFTPLSRGMAASLSLSATRIDGDQADYYYSVSPAQALTSGLPGFAADGGWESAGANLFVGVDLDGDITNGGLSLALLGGYSRMLGDAKRSPLTSVRGSADQWIAGAGLGYTF